MSHKRDHIAAVTRNFEGQDLDAHYLGFFDCFNRQLFFEAHEVLEVLWLPSRRGPDDAFYKGLIQLAGAFVHLQKNRLGPAAALFHLAHTNLEKYPALHHSLDVPAVLTLISEWLARLEPAAPSTNPLSLATAPTLRLSPIRY